MFGAKSPLCVELFKLTQTQDVQLKATHALTKGEKRKAPPAHMYSSAKTQTRLFKVNIHKKISAIHDIATNVA